LIATSDFSRQRLGAAKKSGGIVAAAVAAAAGVVVAAAVAEAGLGGGTAAVARAAREGVKAVEVKAAAKARAGAVVVVKVGATIAVERSEVADQIAGGTIGDTRDFNSMLKPCTLMKVRRDSLTDFEVMRVKCVNDSI
jgi:hypothetical protein